MSAYVVSNKHICALLAATEHYKFHYNETLRYAYNGQTYDLKDKRRAGQVLLDQNFKSVNYRYDENSAGVFRYSPSPKIPVTHVLNLCLGYEYQACENPEWDTSEAYRIIQAIKDHCIQFLPGIDSAPNTL